MIKTGTPKEGYKYFESQQDDEKVILIVRKHWIILLRPFIVGTIIVFLTLIVVALAQNVVVEQIQGRIGHTLLTVLVSLVVLFSILYMYLSWLINYLNIIILTNEHVVEIEQSALFSRKVSELSLDCLEDASFTQKGFFKTILHYGDILVQTAGTLPNFDFKGAPYPYETAQKIMGIQDEYRKSNRVGSNSVPTAEQNEQTLPNAQQLAQGQNLTNNASAQHQTQNNIENEPPEQGRNI